LSSLHPLKEWSLQLSRGGSVFSDSTDPVLVVKVTPTPTPSSSTSEINPTPLQITYPTAEPIPTPSPIPLDSGQLVRFNSWTDVKTDVRNCLFEDHLLDVGAGTTAVISDTQPLCGRTGFFQVRFDDGEVGWVQGSDIEAIAP
jgi:hypothetical protein